MAGHPTLKMKLLIVLALGQPVWLLKLKLSPRLMLIPTTMGVMGWDTEAMDMA